MVYNVMPWLPYPANNSTPTCYQNPATVHVVHVLILRNSRSKIGQDDVVEINGSKQLHIDARTPDSVIA